MTDRAAQIRVARLVANRAKLQDRRRFKTGMVADGSALVAAARLERTMFPDSVSHFTDVSGEAILKDGSMNAKIGGDVLVGGLKGARIYTLTLEERATCPRSCKIWDGCYGNGMPFARRWVVTPLMIAALYTEVREVCAHDWNVLIRLHILGDFPSVEYVRHWGVMLHDFPKLHCFGFTAWQETTAIGAAVADLRDHYPDRFMIRHSGRTGTWGSFTIDWPTPRSRIGDALVCPEQRSSNGDAREGIHCGSCGACWASSDPIAFIEYGGTRL